MIHPQFRYIYRICSNNVLNALKFTYNEPFLLQLNMLIRWRLCGTLPSMGGRRLDWSCTFSHFLIFFPFSLVITGITERVCAENRHKLDPFWCHDPLPYTLTPRNPMAPVWILVLTDVQFMPISAPRCSLHPLNTQEEMKNEKMYTSNQGAQHPY